MKKNTGDVTTPCRQAEGCGVSHAGFGAYSPIAVHNIPPKAGTRILYAQVTPTGFHHI